MMQVPAEVQLLLSHRAGELTGLALYGNTQERANAMYAILLRRGEHLERRFGGVVVPAHGGCPDIALGDEVGYRDANGAERRGVVGGFVRRERADNGMLQCYVSEGRVNWTDLEEAGMNRPEVGVLVVPKDEGRFTAVECRPGEVWKYPARQ